MKRIPASQKMRKELEELLNGRADKRSLLSELIKKGAAIILQELLEEEVTEFLGRGHYERQKGGSTGYRNGYEPFKIKTAEGEIHVYKPQVRNSEKPFRSKLAAFFRNNSQVLEKLAIEMYSRGLSTRDIEDALIEATGDMILSKTAVSNVTEALYKDFEEFQNRDLSHFEVEYLFLDAIYETLRARFGMKEAVLCAWGITRDGTKVLLHLALGNKESYESWVTFLRDMVKRGLRTPITVTTDGAPGLIKAVETIFPESLRIRCWVHRMRNLCSKVPVEIWPDIKAEIVAIRDAAGYEQGKQLAYEFIAKHEEEFPALVRAFQDDLDASLNHLKLPFRHRRYVRTTNLVERSFEEERRRTKVVPCFLTEKSALKLVFSVLIRAARRWRRVSFTKSELNYLDRLRKELGITDEIENEQKLGEVC